MRLPYFRFYVRDYMGAVAHFDNELRGAYMNILCHLWEVEFSSKKDLIFVGFFEKKETKKVLEKWLKIESVLCIKNEGFYYSKRMESERAKAIQDHEKNRVNGMKGGRPKSKIDNPTVNPNHNPTVNPNESETNTQTQTTHNHNHISNIPTEYIDNEDALFLARAQEIDNYQNHEIEGETEEQKQDLDYAYELICQGEENQKTQYVFEPSKLRNAPKSMDEVKIAYDSIVKIGEARGVKSKTSLEFWYKHWEFKNWTDDNGKPIKWQSKLSYNAFESFFDKKEEKVAKPQTQYKQYKQPLYDVDSSRATMMKVYEKLKAQEV